MREPADDDRNLLFGVFALQLEYIDESQFVDACAVWALRRETPLSDVLVVRGWLSPEDRLQVDKLLERKLKKNGGDARKTLGVVADATARSVMRNVDSPVIRKSLSSLPPAAGYVLVETLVRPLAHRSRYELSRLHSEGGLGKVWLARDSDLNREVALKEIQPNQATDPEACRRFVREAQVTGQLEHPNIVPVYELSRRPEDDQPFYTMRFIRGQTLRDAIAAYHKAAIGSAVNALERLRLLQAFVSVSHAVGYAHSRGVIHRDLKPENVVLGGFGEVILLDWGLAKMVDRPDEEDQFPTVVVTDEARVDATRAGRQLGTPAYMAPEQAEGRLDIIDHRTDVYGLGAILFEILTGQPPHVGKDITQLLNQIVTGETPRARSIAPEVPAALEAVCAKAMAKQRAQRYGKASDLADEIQRWLADEPVSAYREPLTTRLIRAARRHRTAVTSISLLLFTSIPILAVSSIKIANEQRSTAQNFKLACDAVNTMLTEVGDVELADIPQLEGKRKKLLDEARDFYVKVFRENPTSSLTVRTEAGRANGRLGDIAEHLGDFKEAEVAYRQSIDSLQALNRANLGDQTSKLELARSDFGLAMLLKKSNRFRESEAAFRDSLTLWNELEKVNPGQIDFKVWRNKTTYQLGATLAKLEGRRSENEALYNAAMTSQEEVIAKNPEPEQLANHARQLNNQGILKSAMGRHSEAEERYFKAIDVLEKLMSDAPSVPSYRFHLANTYSNLAQLFALDHQRIQEAEQLMRKSRTLILQLATDFPKIPDYQQDLARIDRTLADLLMFRAEVNQTPGEPFQEISELLSKALEKQERLAESSPNAPNYKASLAATLASTGHLRIWNEPKVAMQLYARAILTQEALVKKFPNVPEYRFSLGETLASLARAAGIMNDLVTARTQIERAITEQRKAWEADSRNVRYPAGLVEDYKMLAGILIDLNNADEAATSIDKLASVRPDHPKDRLEAAKLSVECISLIRKESSPESKRAEREDRFTRKALDYLRAAYGSGSTLESRELKDKRLDLIRDQADFKKLEDDLKKRSTTAIG